MIEMVLEYKMKKEEILKWKQDRINLLEKFIVASKEDILKHEKEINLLNSIVTTEGLSEFEREFFRLTKEERTNVKLTMMLEKVK